MAQTSEFGFVCFARSTGRLEVRYSGVVLPGSGGLPSAPVATIPPLSSAIILPLACPGRLLSRQGRLRALPRVQPEGQLKAGPTASLFSRQGCIWGILQDQLQGLARNRTD